MKTLKIALGTVYEQKINYLKEVLENCLNYHYPKDHCQEYLTNNLESLEKPGFWQKKILEISNLLKNDIISL